MSYLINKVKRLRLGHSLVSVILAVAVLASTFGVATTLAASAQSVWGGHTDVATAYAGGTGKENDPYLISNGAQLAFAVTSGGNGAYFKLTDNIYLNDTSKINWETGEVISGYTANSWYSSSDTSFYGTIDGDGYVVYGLYWCTNWNEEDFAWGRYGVGLVPNAASNQSTTIKNLGVDKSFVKFERGASAFVGYAGSGAVVTVEQCYAGEKVTVKGASAGAFRGCSDNADTYITNCYSLAAVSGYGNDPSEGLAGSIWGILQIKNSYNANGPVLSATSRYNVTVTACYQSEDGGATDSGAKTLSAENMKDEDVFTNADKMPELNENRAFKAGEGYPTLLVFDKSIDTADIWQGNIATSYAGGTGEATNPYLISNGAQLAFAITGGGGADKYYKLTSDIYLNDVTKVTWSTGDVDSGYTVNSWYNNKAFQGTIDGDGYVVYGLYYDDNKTHGFGYEGVGLIPRVNRGTTATVTDLGIDKAYISAVNGASAFVGFAGYSWSNDSTEGAGTVNISNSYVGKDVSINGYYAAAFRAGSRESVTNLTNCYSIATLSCPTDGEYGLIAGTWGCTAAINNCYITGAPVTSDTWNKNTKFNNTYDTVAANFPDDAATISATNMQGMDVFTNADKMPLLNTSGAYVAQDEYPTLALFSIGADVGKVWDGTSKLSPVKGSGTQLDPFLISTAKELAYVIYTGGNDRYYKLTADIYLNDADKVEWTTGTADDGYTVNSWFVDTPFSGTIDGDGHIVYGLYYNTEDAAAFGYQGVGLIPRVNLGKTVSISELGIEKSYIKGKNGASAFVGFAGPSSYVESTEERATVVIDQCYVGDTVTIDGHYAAAFRGGNRFSVLTLTNSYSRAVTNGSAGKGLFGNVWDTTVQVNNSYNATGPITSDSWRSTVHFSGTYDVQKANYPDDAVSITATNMQGLDVFTNTAKMPALNANGKFTATSGYPVLTVFGVPSEPEPDQPTVSQYWDGSAKIAPSAGDGTKKNPWHISTAAELAYVITSGGNGEYYKLVNDIYLNDLDKVDWTTGEVDDGYKVNSWYENVAFRGTIDGDGYTVYGLYFKTDETVKFGYYGVGLVPRVNRGDSVTIVKLGIDNAYLSGINGASAFVGFAGATQYTDSTEGRATVTVNQCYAGEKVTLAGNDVGVFRGGTYHSDTYISNSYSFATLKGTSSRGLVGNIWSATVTVNNSFNANGTLTSERWSTNASFSNAFGTVENNFPHDTVTLTKDNMQGQDVFTNEAKMPGLNEEAVFIATSTYPELIIFSDAQIGPAVTEKPGDVWTGAVAMDFPSGDGSEDDPYIIETASELAFAVKNNGLGGKYFKLAYDIYLNDISDKLWYLSETNNEWVVAGNFNGHIDGDGHIVYGLWFPEDTENTSSGLISTFMTGSIKNLGVRNAQVNALQFAGGIVGATARGGNKLIDSCFVDETVYVTTSDLTSGTGGILGMAYDMTNSETVSLTVTNCYSKARLTSIAEKRKNGIIGSSWRTPYVIKDCYSVGYPVYTASEGGMVTSAYWNYTPNQDDQARAGKVLSDYISDNYSDTASLAQGVYADCTLFTVIDNADTMRGTAAKQSMSGLDYVNIYETVDGGTPKLKIFTSIDGKDILSTKESDFFGEGIGTQQDPFIIKTVEHLRYVVESIDTKGKYYKLGNDIYINNTKASDWTENDPVEWYAHSNQDRNFAGHLDGDGHTIYGLYYNEAPNPTASEIKAEYVSHGTGLFPYINASASVRNLHIRDSYIKGKGCVGATAGCVLRGEEGERLALVACSVDESVTLHGYTVGGLIGAGNKGVDLTYCYSTAKMTSEGAKNRLNGLIGDIWSAKVNMLQCYTVGYPLMFGNISTANAVYTTVEDEDAVLLTKEQMIGSNAKKYMSDFDWNDVWYTVSGKTPQLKVVAYGEEEPIYDEGQRGRVWSGKTATAFAGGTGTENDPYLIETPEQLAMLITIGSGDGNNHYKLIADIKLNDTSRSNWEQNAKQWYSGMSIFRGVFDGNGHIVSGLYYNKTDKESGDAVGLFQRLGYNSVIKRVGVTNATIISTGPNAETYAGAIVGWLEHWESNLHPERTAPLISECFGDDTVYVEATGAGGMVGGIPERVDIENCFFTGELTGANTGAMVGNAWGKNGAHLVNCYGATVNRDAIGGGSAFTAASVSEGRSTFKNVYVDGPAAGGGPKALSIVYMKGSAAKENMQGFDFSNVWLTCKDGTPVLRCFANASQYSCEREADKVEIAFATLGGDKCESIYGIPGYTKITEDTLPKPVRYGYIFKGWHHFNPNGALFEMDVFPNYDITLYAEWEQVGFTVTFEEQMNATYDFNSGVIINRPGIAGYDNKYIRSGWRSMHTLADSEIAPMFLLSYENYLEVGKEYEITVWMATDVDGTSGSVEFVHTNYPDVNDEIVGYQEGYKFSNLKAGVWTEYKVTFTANAPFLLIRAPIGCSLYFEDIQVVPTGNDGELGKIISAEPDEIIASPASNIIMIVAIVGASVIVLGGIALAVILLAKRKRKSVSSQ